MKRIKILFLMMIMAAMCFVMAGCSNGSTVTTDLSVNSDLSGERVMTVVIDDSSFRDYFGGSADDLKELITGCIPSSLDCVYSNRNAEGNKQFVFTLSFDDPEDYRDKVESILGYEVTLSMQLADSVWATGLYLEESFSSVELLGWLKDAIVDAGYVDSSNAGYILGAGDTRVEYDGEQIFNSSYSNVYVNTLDYVSIDTISVLIDVAEDDRFAETVDITIPYYSMETKGDEIRDYINSLAPTGGIVSESVDAYDATKFSVVCSGLDRAGLESALCSVFGEGNASFTETTTADHILTPLEFLRQYELSIDYSQFVPTDYSSIYYQVLIGTPDGTTCIPTAEPTDRYYYYWDISEYPGYNLVNSGWTYAETVSTPLLMVKEYAVHKISVNTKKDFFGDNWNSTIVLEFQPGTESEILDTIKGRFESDITDPGTSIEIDTSDVPSLRFVQSGTTEAIGDSSDELFGASRDLEYTCEQGWYKLIKAKNIYDSFDLRGLLSSFPNDFILEYTLDTGFGTSNKYVDVVRGRVMSKTGHIVNIENDEPTLRMEYTGSYVDFIVLAGLILIIAVIAVVVIILVKKSLKKKREQQALYNEQMQQMNCYGGPMQMPYQSTAPEQPTPEQPVPERRFCTNCGNPLTSDAMFCENCGHKVE